MLEGPHRAEIKGELNAVIGFDPGGCCKNWSKIIKNEE
jgi:hypothetical protein